MTSRLNIMAGPFTREDFEQLVPVDKKLAADWVKSLYSRGTPEVLRGKELDLVGMPVGGIGTGQLYLGGEGQLWHWDIFNQSVRTASGHYANPPTPASPLTQKFLIQIDGATHSLDRKGFSEVSFRGEYPIGTVEYADSNVPLAVKLEAFSPFIPLNTDDSGLPATIMQFTLRNKSAASIEAMLSGELENGVCLYNRTLEGMLRNRIISEPGLTTLLCSAEQNDSLMQLPDFGTMAIALLGQAADETSPDVTAPFSEKLSGSLGRQLKLAPGESVQVTFVLAWHFPNLSLDGYPWTSAPSKKKDPLKNAGRYYGTKFSSAQAVVNYVTAHFERLAGETKLWRDTWYDSTLPFWFLDRTFLNASTLSTSTSYRFADGRYYGWEGVGCCAGTCGHVYHYAHAAARLFPELEQITREQVDFGLSIQPDGAIHFRGEFNDIPAVDGQAGTILRALREHQMSADTAFLKRNWPKIKLATQWLIAKDANNDGLIESNQHNTLDADWYGKVAWLSGLYLAALLGAAEMADEAGDVEFARQCRGIFEVGRKNLVTELFVGDYFINRIDPEHLDAINSGTGCEIDQVFGQSWAFQVGLPRVLPEKETVAALKSLWRYNFIPDVGPYREVYKPGRWYAMPGEAGLLMCTFPRHDWNIQKAAGKGKPSFVGYFNECMNGFEYQVAGHMLWEGLTLEGLSVTRAVHDRYHASRRNPWNEVECGDHYARSMASYGVYLAACGYEYHGPKSHLGFAPRLTPDNFRCAFTSAEGWGTFNQKSEDGVFKAEVRVKWGKLRLNSLSLQFSEGKSPVQHKVSVNGKVLPSKIIMSGRRTEIQLEKEATLKKGQAINVIIT